jgi:hypothetical protein
MMDQSLESGTRFFYMVEAVTDIFEATRIYSPENPHVLLHLRRRPRRR